MFDFDGLGTEEAWPDEENLGPNRIQVVVSHPIQSVEVKVVLPKRAKFKHIKRALARRFGNDSIVTKGQVVDKVDGVYAAYKDEDRVGSVRRVLVVNADLTGVAEGDGIVTGLIDNDVTEDESQWCTVEHFGGSKSTASSSSRRHPQQGRRPQEERGPASGQGHGRPHDAAVAAALGDLGLGAPWQMGRPAVGGPRIAPAALTSQRRAPAPTSPTLTKHQAMQLQVELYEGFTAPEFQEELHNLLWQAEEACVPRTELIKARQELFFTVQREILPRYGFKESQEGVYQMMAAMGPFIKDPDFIELAEQVNAVVGVENAHDRWGSLQKACQDWDYVDKRTAKRP